MNGIYFSNELVSVHSNWYLETHATEDDLGPSI